MLETLKMLLGIEDDSKDGVLMFVINTVEDEVKNYCHIYKVPEQLRNVIVRMAADLYRSEGYGLSGKPMTAQSVTRGDVTVNYGSGSAASGRTGDKSVIDDYKAQLNAFRRLRW